MSWFCKIGTEKKTEEVATNRIALYGYQRYTNQVSSRDGGTVRERKVLQHFAFEPN